jgi:hypothetical protein
MERSADHKIIVTIALTGAIAAGTALRLCFPSDIEYKLDESGYFENSAILLQTHTWPIFGPQTGLLTPSPGLGQGLITALGWLSGAQIPPDLARAVEFTNVAALLGMAAFVGFAIPQRCREPWRWALALWALNPIAVIFERKIWPVSLLPFFTIALIAVWTYRRSFASAFAWGLCGALMAQVHIGAVCLVFALAIWTAAARERTARWDGWLLGSAIGALPAIPWVIEFTRIIVGNDGSWYWRWPIPSFYFRWITQPFGLGVEYTLGRADMLDFLRGPTMWGQTTYLVGLLYVAIALLTLVAAARTLWRIPWRERTRLQPLLIGETDTAILIRASLIGYGSALTLLTVFGANSHRHYLIAVAPIMALWAAIFVLRGDDAPEKPVARPILAALCVCQALLTLALLTYIHVAGAIRGEFGPTWRYQREHCAAADVGHPTCILALARR